MTRKEEIDKEANDFANTVSVGEQEIAKTWSAFISGAEWADKTMLDRVCKVIEEMLPNYVELNYVFDEISVNYHKFKNNFISDLRKAMKE